MKRNHNKNGKASYGLLALMLLFLSSLQVSAQLNPLAGIYFNNEYLGNPAMAGKEQGLSLNLAYRRQWSSLPGAPVTQSLTAEYGTGKKVGIGLNIHNDEAGLINRTRVMGTYSYHLTLNDESRKLHFGVSLGFIDDRVNNEKISGDQSDPSLSKFNDREMYVDGDFGAAYTSNNLTLQAAIPKLKGFFQKDDVTGAADRSTFFTAASYRFFFPNALDGFGVEPKLAFRGVEGFDNILDAGVNFTIASNAVSVMVVYHSSQSATIGMAANIKSLGMISANYTTVTAALGRYSKGNFQIGLKLNLFQNRKVE